MAAQALRDRLPPDWTVASTRDGRIFFINERDRVTTWLHPVTGRAVNTGHRSNPDLPPGWEEGVTLDGIVYYIDHANQRTTFEHPSRTMMEHQPSRNPPHNSGHETHRSPPQSPSDKSPKRLTVKQRSQRAPSSKRSESSKVVKRGWLHKYEASGLSKSWKRRWAVLADFAVFFYKNEEERDALDSILLPSYRVNHCDRSDPVTRIFAFKLEHENTKTSYLATDTRNDLEHWMTLLKQAADMQEPLWEKNNNTFKSDQPKLIPKSPIIGQDDQEERETFQDFLNAPEMQRSWKDPGSYRRRQQENEAPHLSGHSQNSFPGGSSMQHNSLPPSAAQSRLSAASSGHPTGLSSGQNPPHGIDNPAFRDSLARADDRDFPPHRSDPRLDQRPLRASDNYSQPSARDFGRNPRQPGHDLSPGSRYSGADPGFSRDPNRAQDYPQDFQQGYRPSVPVGAQIPRGPPRAADDGLLADSGRGANGNRSSLSAYGSYAGSQEGPPHMRQQGPHGPRPKSDYNPLYARDRVGQPRDSSFESGQSRDSRSRFSDGLPPAGHGYQQSSRSQPQISNVSSEVPRSNPSDSRSSGSIAGHPEWGRDHSSHQAPVNHDFSHGRGLPPSGRGPSSQISPGSQFVHQGGIAGHVRDSYPGSRSSRVSDSSPHGSNNFSPGSAGSAGSQKRNPGLKVQIPENSWQPGQESHRGGNPKWQSEDGPSRPPFPASFRHEMVKEMAQTKTPHTSEDMLTASQNSMLRAQEPTFFQYPTPREPSREHPLRKPRMDPREGLGRNRDSFPRSEPRPQAPSTTGKPENVPAQNEAQVMRAAFGRVQSFHQDRKEDHYATTKKVSRTWQRSVPDLRYTHTSPLVESARDGWGSQDCNLDGRGETDGDLYEHNSAFRPPSSTTSSVRGEDSLKRLRVGAVVAQYNYSLTDPLGNPGQAPIQESYPENESSYYTHYHKMLPGQIRKDAGGFPSQYPNRERLPYENEYYDEYPEYENARYHRQNWRDAREFNNPTGERKVADAAGIYEYARAIPADETYQLASAHTVNQWPPGRTVPYRGEEQYSEGHRASYGHPFFDPGATAQDQREDHYVEMRFEESHQPLMTAADPRRQEDSAEGRQVMQQQARRPIGTVREDPDMPESQVIETNLKDLAKKYPLNGNRVRMSICASDLVGKTHDELVLLLIQLRRNQSALEKARDYYKQLLDQRRPLERQYRRHRSNSSGDSPGRISREQEEEHQIYTDLRHQQEEIDNKLEVYRPLISLVDNMVTMGSLYGGDNFMLATEYRKHLLRPDQYREPKEMIQWSRQHQERQIVQGIEREVRELSAEEVDLEEKLERLYELDRRLQEQSFKVTSFREDKELLEKTLTGILKRQDQSRNNPREMSRLVNQQITIEKEISKVTQQLAEASRELEETTAESNKLEHEVALLRTKVHGELTRSRSAPSLANENARAKEKMEKELARVQNMMQGLSREGARLSNAMNTLRRSSSGTQLAALLDGDKEESVRKPGTYMQTDLDTMESVDLATLALEASSLSDSRTPRDFSSISSPSRESATQTPRDSARDELPRISHQRQESTLAPTSGPLMLDADADDLQAAWDISEADENTKRFFGILPREKPKGLTVRDVKRQSEQRKEREKLRRGPEDGQDSDADPKWQSDMEVARVIHIPYPSEMSQSVGSGLSSLGQAGDGTHLYENLPRAESTPALTHVISSGISSTPSSRRSSLILLAPKPFKPYENKIGNSVAKPYSSEVSLEAKVFKSSSEMFSGGGGFRPVSMHPAGSASSFSSLTTPRPFGRDVGSMPSHLNSVGKSSRGRYLTISSSKPLELEVTPIAKEMLHSSTAGDLISNRPIDDVPDIVKSSTTKPDEPIDEYTIEREILHRPEKVLIPERYMPDSDEEDLTEAEKLKRIEKVEKIKKILAQQSVHSISQPDISRLPDSGQLHRRVEAEKQRRADLLEVSQQLAKQVTLKSKRDAERRKTWSGDQIAGAMKQHEASEKVPQSARAPHTEKFRV